MLEKIIKLHVFLILFFAAHLAQAQMVVNTTILPPYSPYLSDYATFGNKVVIMITNPTQAMRSVKLMGSITGNGISISTTQNFQPPSPIIVQPNATITVTGNQLAPYYNTDNLTLQGITANQLINGNGLPEGTYTFCYYVADFATGTPLSSTTSGCATIVISHLEPPFLIQPVCESKVTPKTPQNQLFSWTVPAGANPINIEYELTMVELLSGQNPNQALNAATEPVFFRKTVPVSSYLYSQVDPQLTVGKKYAWRIRAKAKPGKTATFKNNGYSAACTFEYKGSGGGGIPDGPGDITNPPNNSNYMLPGDESSCVSACEIPAPANQSPYSPQIGDTVAMGKFGMIISTIAGSTGTGVIYIPFMNARVKVNFTGLQVNTDRQAYGNSKAVAQIDGSNLLDQAIANDYGGTIQMTKDKYNDISNFVSQNQRVISKFAPNMEPLGVPFAMDKNDLNLQIVGLIFTPTQGYMNSIFGYDMADWFGNDFVDFSQKGLCIRPNGFGLAPKFMLSSDKVIQLSEFVDLKFLKGDKTYMELDCEGIKTVKLGGEYLISRDKLLPVQNNAIVGGNTRVKVPFEVTVSQGGNWMVNTTMVPNTFTIPNATDFRFTAEDIKLDLHNTQNPTGLVFPANHPASGGSNNDWKGLYLGSVVITLPDGFLNKANKVTLTVEDLIIDKTGFWADISAQNILSISDGSVGNWKFSIENISIDIEASSLAGGSLAGDIKIPIAETALGYEALIQQGNNGLDWLFEIELQNNLTAELWLATLQLDPGSTVSLEKNGNQFKPVAILNGAISIGFNNSPNDQTPLSKLSLNGIRFQELKVSGGNIKPEIDLAFVSLESQPNGMFSMNKFPINLTGLSYDNGVTPGIAFGLKVNLSKGSNAFEAETDLKVKAKWDGTAKKFKFEGIELQKIAIDCDLGVIAVTGEIELFKDDAKYGTGFRGTMDANLKFASIGIKATIQLGKMGESDQPAESGQNYRYFFIDISARWGVGGLPIPGVGAFAFYGFGGGIYRNMDRNSVVVVTNDKIKDNKGEATLTAGETRSGVVYTPKINTFGFMAAVTVGTTGEPTSFNADVKLTVQFDTDNFGVTNIALNGDAYLMGPIADRDVRLLKIGVEIELDVEKPMFHALITIEGGFNKSKLPVALSVKASLALHFEPGLWYVKLGEWKQDDEPWKDKSRIQVDLALGNSVANLSLNFNAYFMMGNDIGELPRSPLLVRNALGDGDGPNNKTPNTKVALGTGFAMGLGVRLDANINFLIFYANLEFILGADILLSKSTATCNGSTDYGLNGWYAKGIAYAYLAGDIGVRIKIFGYDGSFSLMKMKAAAEMRAELPNPNWVKGRFAIEGSVLNGMITVHTNFTLEIGKKCDWGNEDLLDMPLITEIEPETGGTGSVFEAPQAAFNFKMNKKGQSLYKFDLVDGNGKKRTFKIEVDRMQLTQGFGLVEGNYHFNAAVNGLTFIVKKPMAQFKEHKFEVWVKAYEKVNGNWVFVKEESKSTKFTTGKSPDVIEPANVISAYPQISQRFYLPKDQTSGDIRVGISQCDLMDLKEDKDFKYTYKLRLTNQETKNYSDHAFTCAGEHFDFTIPDNLVKETVYEIKVIRIAIPKAPPINTATNTKNVYRDENGNVVAPPTTTGNINNIQGPPNMQNNGGFNANLNLNSNAGSKLTIKHNEVKNQQAGGEVISKELFKYYFRTSKHKSTEEKFGTGYKLADNEGSQVYDGIMYLDGTQYLYDHKAIFPLIIAQENMDTYEAYGYYNENFDVRVEPLASPELEWGTNDYFKNLNTRVYDRKYGSELTPTLHYFGSGRFNNGHNFFGITDRSYWIPPIQAVKMWHKDTEGPIDLGPGQKILVPKGKLSTNEINKAKTGDKIIEEVPVNYVLPVNNYVGGIALFDGGLIYQNHADRCRDENSKSKKRAQCISDHATPAITFMPSGGGFKNSSPYILTKDKTYPFNIKYGYSYTLFSKKLNFKY